MFGILKYKSSNYKIFISAVIVFIILNIIENYIHYNIGRHHDSQLEFKNPSSSDWIKIIITMIIFALLQGFFTLVLDKYLEK
jgi:hypothetical protein